LNFTPALSGIVPKIEGLPSHDWPLPVVAACILPARDRKAAGARAAASSFGGRPMMLGPENGAAIEPSGNRLGAAAVMSIESALRSPAIDGDRLVGGLIQRLANLISRRLERRAQRRRLQSLGDHLLKDIGVSRCDVEREMRTRWANK
jgi:uncharacterized protein YjiS (DUF1127 family)